MKDPVPGSSKDSEVPLPSTEDVSIIENVDVMIMMVVMMIMMIIVKFGVPAKTFRQKRMRMTMNMLFTKVKTS